MTCPYCKHTPHLKHCLDYVPEPVSRPTDPYSEIGIRNESMVGQQVEQPRDTRAAALAQADTATAQERVLALVSACGAYGVTCDEAEVGMGGLHQSVSAAFHGLRKRQKIRDSGKRRATRTGRAAIVWVLA